MARILAATFIINCLIGLHPAYTSGVCEPPCGANGRCSVATGKCECYLGYTGDTCSEETLPCNGGCEPVCNDTGDGCFCSCPDGFD
ncbi:Teneurin-1, partial [Geodia barretti]